MMYRKLLVYRCDGEGTSWFARGARPPVHPPPEGIEMRWLSADEARAEPGPTRRPLAVRLARLGDEGRCLVGIDRRSGATVYHLWSSPVGAYVDWIFRYLKVPDDGTLAYDVWVDERHRGGAIHKTGAAMAANETLRVGRRAVYAGVEEHEFYPFAAMYSRIGIGIPDAQYFLVGLKIGPLRLHWRRPPSAKVLEFSARLRRRGLRELHDDTAHPALPV